MHDLQDSSWSYESYKTAQDHTWPKTIDEHTGHCKTIKNLAIQQKTAEDHTRPEPGKKF